MLTCPIQPISFEFLPVITFEHSIHTNNVSCRFSRRFPWNGLYRWPSDCSHFVIFVKSVLWTISRFIRAKGIIGLSSSLSKKSRSFITSLMYHIVVDERVFSCKKKIWNFNIQNSLENLTKFVKFLNIFELKSFSDAVLWQQPSPKNFFANFFLVFF